MISFSICFEPEGWHLKPWVYHGYKEVIFMWLCFDITVDWCC